MARPRYSMQRSNENDDQFIAFMEEFYQEKRRRNRRIFIGGALFVVGVGVGVVAVNQYQQRQNQDETTT